MAERYATWTVERRLGAAVAVSLAVHAAAMSLSLPAPRVSLFEPRQVLEVTLREPAAPPAVSPEPARLAPAAPVAEKRAIPERRRDEPLTLNRKSEAPPASPTERVEEERAPEPGPETSIASHAPAAQPPSAPLMAHVMPRVSRSEVLSTYGQTISQALARYKEYPRIAQMQGWQGAVTMRLRVAPSGHLISAEVHASSGHEALDRQALAMASKPERFPPPPDELRDSEIAVLVPVVFRLER